jgi:hypothetical protein
MVDEEGNTLLEGVVESESELELEWMHGTQMQNESFESVLCDVDVDVEDEAALDAAASRLTYANDREIAKMAIRLVYRTYPEWFSKSKGGPETGTTNGL